MFFREGKTSFNLFQFVEGNGGERGEEAQPVFGAGGKGEALKKWGTVGSGVLLYFLRACVEYGGKERGNGNG